MGITQSGAFDLGHPIQDQHLMMALTRVYAEAYASCHAAALSVLKDHHLAEDAVQEAFEVLLADASRFNANIGPLRPYMLMVVRRRAIDSVRRISRQRQAEAVLSQGNDKDPGVDERVIERFHARDAELALARLPLAQRAVLQMIFWQGLSHAQVAVAMGLPLGTVKTRSRDGLIRLRKILATED